MKEDIKLAAARAWWFGLSVGGKLPTWPSDECITIFIHK